MIGIVLSVRLTHDTKILACNDSEKGKIARLLVIALPGLQEFVVGLAAGGVGRQITDEVHPVFAGRVFQRPSAEIGPVVADQVWVFPILETGLFDLRLSASVALADFKDVDEAETPPLPRYVEMGT